MQPQLAQKNSSRRSYLIRSEAHSLDYCNKFNTLCISHGKDFIFRNKLCANCFKGSHIAPTGNSTSRCLVYQECQHTLGHEQASFNHSINIGSGPANRESFQPSSERNAHQVPSNDTEDSLDELTLFVHTLRVTLF